MPNDSADADQDAEVSVMWPDRLSACLHAGVCGPLILLFPVQEETFAEHRDLNKNYTIV